MTFSRNTASGAGDIFDGLTGHGLGHKADEVTGMTRLHGNADFAIGLEASNPRAMAGPRVDDHERPSTRGINFNSRRRNNMHQQVIDRPLQASDRPSPTRPYSRGHAEPSFPRGVPPRYWLPRWRITSQKRIVRWAASRMYSSPSANGLAADAGSVSIAAGFDLNCIAPVPAARRLSQGPGGIAGMPGRPPRLIAAGELSRRPPPR